jgi:hypothetical protein
MKQSVKKKLYFARCHPDLMYTLGFLNILHSAFPIEYAPFVKALFPLFDTYGSIKFVGIDTSIRDDRESNMTYT